MFGVYKQKGYLNTIVTKEDAGQDIETVLNLLKEMLQVGDGEDKLQVEIKVSAKRKLF